jgi:hypothetical protein
MYLHMGAFHTNKFAESAGSRIAKEHPPTMGRVFSVGPAWGEGSVIYYGGEMDLPPSPTVVADALADGTADPTFVSTSRPSGACVGNPLAPIIDEVAFGPMSETYDGYLHIRRLTPENRPNDATIRLALPQLARFWHIRDRITDLERRAGRR